MESKLLIDINYSSRWPQILIHQKESDDPRDKLVSMFTGHSMPGVRDGFCRIERMPTEGTIVITPVSPPDMVANILEIVQLGENNACVDTSEVREQYQKILESEYARVFGDKRELLKKADDWAVLNMPPDLYKKWQHDMFGHSRKESSQG